MHEPERCEVVVVGAGIAGVAAAHWLAVHAGIRDIVVVDDRPPLTLTSDKSTEAYRNFWPGPDAAMIELMNRSLDLMEDLARRNDDVFRMNRRGYLYATASTERAAALEHAAVRAAAQGAGALRVHSGGGAYTTAAPAEFRDPIAGADLLRTPALLRRHFPYLDSSVVAALHVRRAGWFSGQQLGMLLLERAREHGVRLESARLEAVDLEAGRVRDVWLRGQTGELRALRTACLVNAAGPHLSEVAGLLGVTLPVFCELHLKMAFRDTRSVLPRTAPLLIWDDAQLLEWSSEERDVLAAPETRWLLEPLPAGVHGRPEGGGSSDQVLLLWPYHGTPVEPRFPLPEDDWFAEIALRGMSTMLPGLRSYFDALPRAHIDGGYYVKTRENRCLVGPLPVQGAYVLGALSGYGLMVACGAAELLAAHVTGAALPPYASAFTLGRYDDPAYRARLDSWGPTGEL